GKRLEKHLQDLGSKQEALLFDREERSYVHGEVLEELKADVQRFLVRYHRQHPMRVGVTRSEFASGWGRSIPVKLLHFVLERAVKEGVIQKTDDTYHAPEHRVSLAADQEQFKAAFLARYQQAGLRPPNLREVLAELDVSHKEAEPVLRLLAEAGELVKVKEDLYFAPEAIEDLKKQVREYFQTQQSMNPTDFKDLTGLSRKYTIPLLEFLDREKVTMRVGDVRHLRQG
ncbi:MAG: SelB C-terminal domain-containing protein, partial [Desulfohalobium sp.]